MQVPATPIRLSRAIRTWARCALCGTALGAKGYGSTRTRGLYCSSSHVEQATDVPALGVVVPYLPEPQRREELQSPERYRVV